MTEYEVCLTDGTLFTVKGEGAYTKSLSDKTIFFDKCLVTICIVPDNQLKYILKLG